MEPVEVIIDYAYPCMMAENALRKVHEYMLQNNFDAAIEESMKVLVETKLMLNAIKEMKGRTSADTKEL
jgi:hypothetical protein